MFTASARACSHGSDSAHQSVAATTRNRYYRGTFLTPHDDPARIIAHSARPIPMSEAAYETEGFYGNVVFSCGALLHGDRLRVYYGAADECIALAEARLNALLDSLTPEPGL